MDIINVIDILKKQKDMLIKLLDAVEQERKALVEDNIEELNRVVNLKNQIKCSMDELENKRIAVCGNLKLKDMVSKLSGNEREELSLLGKDMEEIVLKIQEINNTNQLLVKQSLNYVGLVKNLLSPKQAATYNPSGRIGNSSAHNNILNRSV